MLSVSGAADLSSVSQTGPWGAVCSCRWLPLPPSSLAKTASYIQIIYESEINAGLQNKMQPPERDQFGPVQSSPSGTEFNQLCRTQATLELAEESGTSHTSTECGLLLLTLSVNAAPRVRSARRTKRRGRGLRKELGGGPLHASIGSLRLPTLTREHEREGSFWRSPPPAGSPSAPSRPIQFAARICRAPQ